MKYLYMYAYLHFNYSIIRKCICIFRCNCFFTLEFSFSLVLRVYQNNMFAMCKHHYIYAKHIFVLKYRIYVSLMQKHGHALNHHTLYHTFLEDLSIFSCGVFPLGCRRYQCKQCRNKMHIDFEMGENTRNVGKENRKLYINRWNFFYSNTQKRLLKNIQNYFQ